MAGNNGRQRGPVEEFCGRIVRGTGLDEGHLA
jgi:hypothetical protein